MRVDKRIAVGIGKLFAQDTQVPPFCVLYIPGVSRVPLLYITYQPIEEVLSWH
ncbi:MAG: hypothetical protein NVS2B12_11940 [Ktedonobacteraceae bacterium]